MATVSPFDDSPTPTVPNGRSALDVLSHQGSIDYPGGIYGTADSGTITGTLWTVTTTGQTPITTRYTTSGTIACAVGDSHAADLANAGMDHDALAEGVLDASLGDNVFLPTVAP